MDPSILDSGIVDLLEADPRPSFIVTLSPHPSIVYTNPALGCHAALLNVLTARPEDTGDLWKWITHVSPDLTGPSSFHFLNILWTRAIVEEMVVVGANEQKPESEPPRKPEVIQSLKGSTTDPGWILPTIVPEQRPFLEVIHSVDWAATPFGPMKNWPARLERAFNQILADSRPIAIYWGSTYSIIYNEAFSKLCGSKHPALLGMTVEDAWREAGVQLKDAMRSIARKERGVVEDEWRYFVEREAEVPGGPNWLEETYLKWSIIPIVEDNDCIGFMHPVLDTTSMRLWERRMKMLIELGEVLVTARDVKSYWAKTLEKLAAFKPRYDIPMAILYSVEEDPDVIATNPPPSGPTKMCRLAGALGVPDGHPMAPETLNLRNGNEALTPIFREALTAHHPILIRPQDGTLPEALLQGLQWRGFEGEPCRAAVICPIRPTKEENAMGLLLLGLNPRRPYDNDYRQYISLLNQKLTTSLASIVLLEEEARRGRNAAEQAAYDQAILKEKLAAQTKEANESMQMFEAIAEFVPVGMCFGDPQGNITFANDAWYKITGYPETGPMRKQGFLDYVKEEEDRQMIAAAYERLKTERNVEFVFRVERQSNIDNNKAAPPLTRNSPSFEKSGLDLAPIDKTRERHVLATAKAERAPDGTIIRILTCLADVTAHKQAAEEAVQRAQQAENLKRMAEFATVGMYDMDLHGRLLGANNVFFEMCGLDKVDPTDVVVKPWETCVGPEEQDILRKNLDKVVMEGTMQNFEIRLKTMWTAEDGGDHQVVAPRWVQATLMPVLSSEGVIQSFTGCLSDVSLQKWQLEREKQRKEEAIESKRQQENFIDMTSHEMRNPLSAIIHCADAIMATLARVQQLVELITVSGGGGDPSLSLVSGTATDTTTLVNGQSGGAAGGGGVGDSQSEVRLLVESSIDSAETIVGCAQHQKRIVDDILTMSKLDSNLLAITPITVNPILIVKEALKMFEVEARRVDINLSMVVDQSYRDLGIKYLDFDPSRLKQVLINLLTNALKFTKTGPTRNVSVAINASLDRPSEATSSVQFIPRSEGSYEECGSDHHSPAAPRSGGGSDGGKPVYLMFEVKDTGQGLTEEEKNSLFQRFVQASSRTHIKYGGSGLGLFISRRLTELQNGAIGVASQPGVGSTFAFYIKTHMPSSAAMHDAEATANLITTTRLAAAAAVGSLPSFNTSARVPPSLSSLMIPSPNHGRETLSPSPSPSPQISGIMVVEDNLINQQITCRGLEDLGFTVEPANHGVECLEKLWRTDRYLQSVTEPGQDKDKDKDKPLFPLSVILMDIEMPIQDGLTCTRNIRELERQGKIVGGRIPIIAVSANARMEQIMEAKEAGCDDVLVKPYRMPELLEKMRIAIGSVKAGV
ncbi:hypothetical protein B0T17DRAFT_588653 [Bombardia bombarda]|uniref:Uncharacterized protein n=1 Tax=Bombardia bombarda TaxID=252184 RepID=A0AA39X7X4_9PEZI|nr:hypothetical protein B0T17DRAFT_588653 [Bombardia bombarda]